MNADPPRYPWPKYECFLIRGCQDISILMNFNVKLWSNSTNVTEVRMNEWKDENYVLLCFCWNNLSSSFKCIQVHRWLCLVLILFTDRYIFWKQTHVLIFSFKQCQTHFHTSQWNIKTIFAVPRSLLQAGLKQGFDKMRISYVNQNET